MPTKPTNTTNITTHFFTDLPPKPQFHHTDVCTISSLEDIKTQKGQISKRLSLYEWIFNDDILNLLTPEVVEYINDTYLDTKFTYMSPIIKCLLFLNSIRYINSENFIVILTLLCDSQVNLVFNDPDKDIPYYKLYQLPPHNVDENIIIREENYTCSLMVLDKLYNNISIFPGSEGQVMLYDRDTGGVVNHHYKIDQTANINVYISNNYSTSDILFRCMVLNDKYKGIVGCHQALNYHIKEMQALEDKFQRQSKVYSKSLKDIYFISNHPVYMSLQEYLKEYPELVY